MEFGTLGVSVVVIVLSFVWVGAAGFSSRASLVNAGGIIGFGCPGVVGDSGDGVTGLRSGIVISGAVDSFVEGAIGLWVSAGGVVGSGVGVIISVDGTSVAGGVIGAEGAGAIGSDGSIGVVGTTGAAGVAASSRAIVSGPDTVDAGVGIGDSGDAGSVGGITSGAPVC